MRESDTRSSFTLWTSGQWTSSSNFVCPKGERDHAAGTCGCLLARGSGAQALTQSLDEVRHEKSLCEASRRGDLTRVRKLLAKGDNVDECTCGYSPLLYASRQGHLDVVKALAEAGADLFKPTRSLRSSALHRAAASNRIEVVRYLLSKDTKLAKLRDADGNLAIHKAANPEVFALLLQAYPESIQCQNNRGEQPKRSSTR